MADHCCAPEQSTEDKISSLVIAPAEPAPERADLIRRAFRLEWLTIGWMIIEAAVAIGAAVAAHSLSLAAFVSRST